MRCFLSVSIFEGLLIASQLEHSRGGLNLASAKRVFKNLVNKEKRKALERSFFETREFSSKIESFFFITGKKPAISDTNLSVSKL